MIDNGAIGQRVARTEMPEITGVITAVNQRDWGLHYLIDWDNSPMVSEFHADELNLI